MKLLSFAPVLMMALWVSAAKAETNSAFEVEACPKDESAEIKIYGRWGQDWQESVSWETLDKLGIDADKLKKAIGDMYFDGHEPDGVYLDDDNPWQLFERHGWQLPRLVRAQPFTTLVSKSVAKDSFKKVSKNDGEFPYTVHFEFDRLSSSIDISWQTDGFIDPLLPESSVSFTTVCPSIVDEMNTPMSVDAQQDFVVGTSGVSHELQPGSSLTFSRMRLAETLRYEFTSQFFFTGNIAVNFAHRDVGKGHFFWAIPLNEVLHHLGIPLPLQIKAAVEAKTFSRAGETDYDIVLH